VLAVTGGGPSFEAARERAYQAVKKISFAGMQYRSDIGAKALEVVQR
jgi:phosphoribosylamine---glycine ligase